MMHHKTAKKIVEQLRSVNDSAKFAGKFDITLFKNAPEEFQVHICSVDNKGIKRTCLYDIDILLSVVKINERGSYISTEKMSVEDHEEFKFAIPIFIIY